MEVLPEKEGKSGGGIILFQKETWIQDSGFGIHNFKTEEQMWLKELTNRYAASD